MNNLSHRNRVNNYNVRGICVDRLHRLLNSTGNSGLSTVASSRGLFERITKYLSKELQFTLRLNANIFSSYYLDTAYSIWSTP